MDREAIRSLVIDLAKLDNLTLEGQTELELKYQIQDNFLSEMWYEIIQFKKFLDKEFNTEIFFAFLENNYITIQEQYAYYEELIKTYWENEHEYLNKLDETRNRIIQYKKFLGMDSKDIAEQKGKSK